MPTHWLRTLRKQTSSRYSWRDLAVNLLQHRRRRIQVHRGRRVHIELRDLSGKAFREFSRELADGLEKLEGVEAYHVNGPLRRVVVAYRSALTSPRNLVALVEGVEEHLGLQERPFCNEPIEVPGDLEPLVRTLVEVTADSLGVTVGTLLRLFGFKPSRLGFDIAATMSILAETPRMRARMEQMFGEPALEVAYGSVNAFVQAVGSGPVGPLVDLIHKWVMLRGDTARKQAWDILEPGLFHGRHGETFDPPQPPPKRPRPLPDGVIEQYADEAWFASLGGFVVGLADTHEFEPSTAPLFGGLPKAAEYGRDGFCAELTRVLAERGTLALRPRCLKRLDRIDCVVVDADILTTGELMTGRIRIIRGSEEVSMDRLRHLFDLDAPTASVEEGSWRLETMADFRGKVDGDVAVAVEALRVGRMPVLGLSNHGELRALVALRPNVDPSTEQLYASAHRAGLKFVVAASDKGAASILPADTIIGKREFAAEIADLQRDGYGVAVVSAHAPEAMAAADLSVAVGTEEGQTGWGADLICTAGTEEVGFVLEACAMADQVAGQSTVLAGVGATLGAFMSIRGLSATDPGQVKSAVNAVAVTALANGIRRAVELDQRPRPPRRDPTPWHALSRSGVVERLESSLSGLSDREARGRRRRPQPEPSDTVLVAEAIADELINPLTPVLGAGAAISAIVGSLGDAGLVTAVILFNAGLSGAERYRSERAVARLEQRERLRVRVRREGAVRVVDAEELVRGDVIELEAGDVVPADCRLLRASNLEVDQSSITGESIPVRKQSHASFAAAVADRSSMLYEGTAVAAGQAVAVIVAVGRHTEAGRAFAQVAESREGIGLEARLRDLTNVTVPAAGWASGLLTLVGLMRQQDIVQLADSAVGMAVAAVPEGLPLLSTAAQMAAARRLSTHGALVRNPRAIEALGRVDVVCADKTGTLTEGKIELHVISDGARDAMVNGAMEPWQRRVLAAALRAGPAGREEELPHPTDRAIVQSATRHHVDALEGVESWIRLDAIPFEPSRGYYGVLGRRDEELVMEVKGAPEVVLEGCVRHRTSRGDGEGNGGDSKVVDIDESRCRKLIARSEALAGRGLRVLAVAERSIDEPEDFENFEELDDMTLVGFVALRDPPRDTSAEAIRRLRVADVDTVMITGDHPTTAHSIAQDVGLLNGRDVITGADIDALDDPELADRLDSVAVIARATPSQKGRIVRALQAHDKVVAMTGDGANDAGAIRIADIGIALGEDATRAAREAADLIVVDERIETIVRAVGEGRAMVNAVEQAAALLTGGNFGEIAFTLLGGVLTRDPPMNARQLLLVNLLTDVAPAMATALKPPSEEFLDEVLETRPEEVFGRKMERDIAFRAIVTAGTAGGAWALARCLPGGRRRASTVGLVALVGSQLGQTIAIENPTRETLWAGFGSAAILLGITVTPGLSHLFGCRPIGPIGVGIATGAATITSGMAGVATRMSGLQPSLAERARGWLFARERATDEQCESPE